MSLSQSLGRYTLPVFVESTMHICGFTKGSQISFCLYKLEGKQMELGICVTACITVFLTHYQIGNVKIFWSNALPVMHPQNFAITTLLSSVLQ